MFIREVARSGLASVMHRLKTVKVGHRIADSQLAVWVCGQGAVIARLRYGAQAVVFANEYNGRSMYLWGEHDPRITAVIKAVLREGDTVLDIGANFGVTGLLAAKSVGSAGTVHLFEPQPLVASCLRASLLINGYSNAVVHECALSSHNGSATMAVLDSSNMGMTTLSSPNSDSLHPSHSVKVRIENAGEYVTSLGCGRVTLIKIDVEGHEPVIFQSMRKWLADKRVPVILFECHLDHHGFQEHETVRILSGLGYEFLAIDTRPYWHTRLRAVPDDHRGIGYDFMAVLWQELDDDRRMLLQAMVVPREQ